MIEKAKIYMEMFNDDYAKALKEFKLDLRGQVIQDLHKYNLRTGQNNQYRISEKGEVVKLVKKVNNKKKKKKDKDCNIF